MSELTTVAVDAMGGDNAPYEIVKGAIEAINRQSNIKVLLVGDKEKVAPILGSMSYPKDQLELIHASEVIETAESPVEAIRKKKNSSLVISMKLIKEGEADALVSAGNTGALLVGGQVVVGRIKGVSRTPLAVLMPTKKGISLLLDCGANVDARASHLVQFAMMGSIYMENVLDKKNPTVGLVNVGAEEEKGNALVKETFPLLRECPGVNFIGSVEAREIPEGASDVIVCEAFVGNVILKLTEGVGTTMISMVKNAIKSSVISKIGGLLVRPALRKAFKKFDVSEYGGAPLLGLKGLVVKTHGSSTSKEIANSIVQCVKFKEQQISKKIGESISLDHTG